ncbi:organic hydroperoxide resistance protein [Candidimonas nitroreducens]|uniref:Organic hydroperoxide resistance protein n=1 Tax=Candidimonas nitroreducens TaxID=683354 RepID=A0A225MZ26_9BURK|nr:organic hydroperoxide resistance protein [Candidimonas nitroreducens]OWT63939.1 organic hydroperoxide resistance protein [Candidimonas nitroreducens]
MAVLYTTRATAFNGREGRVATEDGALALQLSRPREMGGSGIPGTNPEQLFAAGYAGCFGATLQALARARKITLERNEVTAEVGLVKRDEGGFVLSATLDIILSAISHEDAAALVEEAHRVCPYSNSIKATIDVQIRYQLA